MPSSTSDSPLDEGEVTQRVAAFLKTREWKILLVHTPGSHGGLSFSVTVSAPDLGRKRVIPDIIAQRGRNVLVVESKSRFTRSDVSKLEAFIALPESLLKIARRLRVSFPPGACLVPAIAVAAPNNKHLPVLPGDFALFVVDKGSVVPSGVWGALAQS